jgi:RND family efflux transporter MFP subunit
LGLLLGVSAIGCGDDPAQAGGPGGGEGGGGGPPGGPPASVVVTAPVERQTIGTRRELTGSLQAVQRSEVATIEPGRVLEVRFTEADRVKEGDVLVILDARRLQEDLAVAESEVAVAEAVLQRREAELEQLRNEAEARSAAAERAPGSVSELTLRQAQTAADVAAAEVNAAEKQLSAAQTRVARVRVQLADTEITAPFDGVVVRQSVEVGEYLSPGDPVAVLSSTGTYEAFIEVPERVSYAMLANAAPDSITVRVETLDLRLTPESLRLVPDVDPRSRRFTLIAVVKADEDDSPLAAGMSVVATIPAGEQEERLVVPVDAVQRDAAGDFVRIVAPGQMGQSAIPVGVRVLFRTDDLAIIEENPQLQVGTPVIVEGGERLRPGEPVQTSRGEAAGGAASPPSTAPAQQ